jgi:hypothetical protein
LAAELLPLLEELAVLVEDLNPVVAAVADEQPSLNRTPVCGTQTGREPIRAHCLMNFLPGEFQDACVASAIMAVETKMSPLERSPRHSAD